MITCIYIYSLNKQDKTNLSFISSELFYVGVKLRSTFVDPVLPQKEFNCTMFKFYWIALSALNQSPRLLSFEYSCVLNCPPRCPVRFIHKCLRELNKCLTPSQFPQTFLTNPSKHRIYLCQIPTVIRETLIV